MTVFAFLILTPSALAALQGPAFAALPRPVLRGGSMYLDASSGGVSLPLLYGAAAGSMATAARFSMAGSPEAAVLAATALALGLD